MALLVLEGATLGMRHQHYNNLLNKAIAGEKVQPAKIDYEKTDVENLFNIDIASYNEDVEYILDVLKGEDMLYVSRAIKWSSWLINDDQFAHIIEPEYLHSELFPKMMPKGSCKFLLHVRLTLKDESRVDKFFQYFRDKDLTKALKWLPNCTLNVIEDAVGKHACEISPNLFKRLCERSTTVLKILALNSRSCLKHEFKAAMILLRSDTETYMDALSCINHCLPKFGKKQTKIVMTNCPHWFINNFKLVMNHIDLDTFAKYLNKEEIKSYVLEELQKEKVKLFLDQEKLNNFIKYMPNEEKYEFVKQFIETNEVTDNETSKCAMISVGGGCVKNSSIYLWYKHAPFIVAFGVLKKMIRRESNPDERNAMLMILVQNARSNLAHIHSILSYYRKRHINEPFRCKVQLMDDLLQTTDPLLYDDKMWTVLEEIFCSMEVYKESEKDVQTCIKCIIVHKVTRDQEVPDIIEQKFNFDSLKTFQRNLNESQQEKVFNYLYNVFLNELDNLDIFIHAEFAKYIEVFTQGLNLLKDWKKELVDYPVLITKIKDCIRVQKEKGWSLPLTQLYNANKLWRKNLFEESLALVPSPVVCMYVLKHDPEFFVRHEKEVDALRYNDAVHMDHVLRKLRVYWAQTMASEWVSAYREQLKKPSGHKAAVRGLCSLLNKQQLISFLSKYELRETKIKWTDADTDDNVLSLRKNIARSMHIARPQITVETVLSYAKDDYVQFAQPSLNAILYNVRSSDSREGVLNLLNGTTTLQKHGINLAFSKLSSTDIKEIFLDVWTCNKNLSVRAALFKNTHELLCRERDEALLAGLWELMEMFIDSLTDEENKEIYNTIGKLANVHPSIKPAYCIKGYNFLKSLPPKTGCNSIIKIIKGEMLSTVEVQDSEFIDNIILDFVDQVLLNKSYTGGRWTDMQLLVSYLLYADDECTQLERYEKVFIPLMERSFLSWDKTYKHCSFVRRNFKTVMEHLHLEFPRLVLRKKKNKVYPSCLYRSILTKLEGAMPAIKNYVLCRQLKLAIAFIEFLDKNKPDLDTVRDCNYGYELQKLYSTIISDVGDVVTRYLKEDVDLYTASIYRLFGKALNNLWDSFEVHSTVRLKYLQNCLTDENNVPMYMLVIYLIRTSYCSDDEKEDLIQIHNMLKSHPSTEIEILYFDKFGDDPMPDE